MSVINTNTKALFSQNALQVTGRSLTKAMEQLSSGKRINTAGDDAAGLAIATRMTQQIRSLDQAFRNAGDAIALIQTAEGATNEITDMLQRMRELAIQAINDTNNNEQRSYLDLEFQQLKQEISRTAEMTEWNGFKILNGSTGTPVGERPVYKATSTDEVDTVFINPTTSRVLSGRDFGVVEEIELDGSSKNDGEQETITLQDGRQITVQFSDDDNDGGVDDLEVAAQVAAALINDEAFNGASGRRVEVIEGANGRDTLVRISYSSDETDALYELASTNSNDLVDDLITIGTGSVTRYGPVDVSDASSEAFNLNGEFLLAGSLNITLDGTEVDGDEITARFLTTRGDEIRLTGTLTLSGNPAAPAGTDETSISFLAEGENAKVISTPLTYTFKVLDEAGEPQNGSLEGRAVSLSVDVEGSIPGLRSDDLHINGVNIGPSYADDDTLSPPNNAAGSAIAIAAAINRKTSETGVAAVVNPNILSGTGMTAGGVVTGRLMVNGYSTPEITTVLNNTRASREAVVEAVNFISHLTGVVAVDTGTDALGVQLRAEDGRNIEVQFDDLDTTSSVFAGRTGLRTGVLAGTYSLEARVETAIQVSTTATGDITRARLPVGDFRDNVSTLTTALRSVVTTADDVVAMSAGDLKINGIAIPAAVAGDDDVSDTTALTSDRAASAIAMAAAINRMSDLTQVRAETVPAFIEGTEATRVLTTGQHSLFVNGVEISVDFSIGSTTSERVDEVIDRINTFTGRHGVHATKSELGGLVLETIDGRNLSIWHDDEFDADGDGTDDTSLTASEFGLGATIPSGAVTALADATSASTGAATVYGRVRLIGSELSPGQFPTDPRVPAPAFSITPGANGYNSDSNFEDLGFQEGTFGGEVDEATSKMTPPRTGRISFQVGATAGQLITIDLADFGKGGPITSTITGDVDDAVQVNKIDTRDDASAVLSKLDAVMDKVNATRAVMGAVMNRLQYTMDNLSNASMNQAASRSQIQDADYAKASTELAKTQLMQQAATAVLAQANQSQQSVLQLLQG